MSSELLRAQLAEAEKELQSMETRWDNYSGNNPNKYQAGIKALKRKTAALKRRLGESDDAIT